MPTADATPGPGPAATIRRRHVLYVSGFDPQGPAHYHALYRAEAGKQALVSGYSIDVGPRQRGTAHSAYWDVRWTDDGGQTVDSRYEFLRWDDIVRKHWPRGTWRLVALTLATTTRMVINGSLWRILQTSWPAFMALAAPAALLAGCASGVAGLAVACAALMSLGHHAAGGVLLVGGLATLGGFARWAQGKVQMAWLMRSARAILLQAGDGRPELEQRLDAFAGHLLDLSRRPGIDELMVVGHSSGAMLAASVVARAIRRDAHLLERPGAPKLLTLGECIPVLSYQPEASAFRAELGILRAHTALCWLDVTAPSDGCCFALIDPTEVCLDGLAAGLRMPGGPKRLSPRFVQLFSSERYANVRADKYRCHFQYLMSGELRGVYDYFAITAGPLSLEVRFSSDEGIKNFEQFRWFGGPRR